MVFRLRFRAACITRRALFREAELLLLHGAILDHGTILPRSRVRCAFPILVHPTPGSPAADRPASMTISKHAIFNQRQTQHQHFNLADIRLPCLIYICRTHLVKYNYPTCLLFECHLPPERVQLPMDSKPTTRMPDLARTVHIPQWARARGRILSCWGQNRLSWSRPNTK
jgi:hypothetical protein